MVYHSRPGSWMRVPVASPSVLAVRFTFDAAATFTASAQGGKPPTQPCINLVSIATVVARVPISRDAQRPVAESRVIAGEVFGV